MLHVKARQKGWMGWVQGYRLPKAWYEGEPCLQEFTTLQKQRSRAPAIGATGLLVGGVGGVKGIKLAGCGARLQGGFKSVLVDCCGMCGKVGGRNRDLRECRWTPPAGCTLNSLVTWQALPEKSAQ